MLALLKKNGSSTYKNASMPWRADFRHVELLPDTKTVRTTFLLNAIIFTVLGSLVLFLIIREMTISGLKGDIESVQAQISEAEAPNLEAEAKYKKFQIEEKKVKDLQALSVSSFSFPDFLTHFASLMPAGVKSTRIEFRGVGQNILVIGSVDGQDATSSEVASRFIGMLQQDEKFKEIFSSVTNSNLGRNATTDSLSFELIFNFHKPVAAKK